MHTHTHTENQYCLDISILIQLDTFIGNRIAQANNNFVYI